jgi:phenylpropionate dioxygenase-like ring-hydroxylating dioxygenase large terminal subunit
MSMLRDSLLDELEQSTLDVASASTLPSELYTSAEILDFEREAVFAHDWLCAGRADRLVEPGDWFTVTICDEPIIVLRDKLGEIRALSAVCQHRAMQVCDGSGNDTTLAPTPCSGALPSG